MNHRTPTSPSRPTTAPPPCSAAGAATPEGGAAQFPTGLQVLVVDDNPSCLKHLETMLTECLYNVTTCSRAVIALSMLCERKGGFDLVLSEVHMPDMDGFKLLECIGEMGLPVIMMSTDDGNDVLMKGVTHGACDYLIKPVRMEAVKNIWQHVYRKRINGLTKLEHSESHKQKRPLQVESDNVSSMNEGNGKTIKRRKEGKEEEDKVEENNDSLTLRKRRLVWTPELHQQFLSAVEKLDIDKAVPTKIRYLMGVPELTRENIASHLQKHRLHLRRQHQGRFDQINFSNFYSQNVNSSGIRSASSGNMCPQVSEGTSGLFHFPSSLRTSSLYPGGIINGRQNNSPVMQTTQQGQHISFSQQQNHMHIDMQRHLMEQLSSLF